MMEIIIGSIAAAFALVLFADLSRNVISEEILLFDHDLSRMIYSYRTPFMTQIALGITFLGGSIWLTIASVALMLFLILKKYYRAALIFIFTFSTGVLLNLLLKHIIARARPEIEPLLEEIFYSYPSGHSMNAFIFYALVAYLTYHISRNLPVSLGVVFVSSILILSIGISRIYLGVHYPSDVLAGFLGGTVWFLTVLVITKTLTVFRYRSVKKVHNKQA